MTIQVSSTVPTRHAEWSQGLARLSQMPPPQDYAGVHAARWKQLVSDAGEFLLRWESEATALGWNTIDLFGCDRVKPRARVDLAGLLLLLNGRRVVELSAGGAMIEEHGDRHTRFTRRSAQPEQVVLWDLAPLTTSS